MNFQVKSGAVLHIISKSVYLIKILYDFERNRQYSQNQLNCYSQKKTVIR